MAFVEKDKHISGNMVIDGTLTADQVQTDSLTANKFKGATEEQYFNKFGGQSIASFNYVTLHEFDFPTPELELVKSQSIKVTFNGTLFTGTSGTAGSTVYLYIEVKVPDSIPFREIGFFTHESFQPSNYQRAYITGNYLNRFGAGEVGSISTYRFYRNLRFEQFHALTDSNVVSNGFFGTADDWTSVSGTFTSEFGVYGQIKQDATADNAHIYQQVTTTAGETYRFDKTVYSQSSANASFHLSTSSDIADAFFTDTITSAGGSSQHNVKIDYDSVYVIVECDSPTQNNLIAVDNVNLFLTEPRTYVDVSTAGGQVISTSGRTRLYHHPFGSASAGTWKVVKTVTTSVRTNAYTHFFTVDAEAFLGIEKISHECRIRARHFFSGDTLNINDGTVIMKSRMTGEQNE
jgi:hypothetical protein